MNIVAGSQDELPGLILFIVFDAPKRHFVAQFVPIKAEKAAFSRLVLLNHL